MSFAIRASSVALVIGAVGIVGGGAAAANSEYNGMTYEKASNAARSNDYTAVISTVIGSELPTDQCIVTNASRSITLNSTGRRAHSGTMLFDLNCNLAVAQPGKSGNSVVTPQGKKAKSILDDANLINTNVEKSLAKGATPFCGRDAAHLANCVDFCNAHELCSRQALDYLATVTF
ncbi:hypothetical protein CRM90_17595 [Mycobacterium sp. ENV421]|uniref:hypothetical protein n=1 Tax=Mycobacterium sp. ENV421 TaxID=1213407 RepID=UPI000C9C5B8D|nr:hypothetical protein [Mycobacterium sp. ENV421]PND56415.1 hypothetical protein CRM90_17595 [Mycobacterium sp. ENV421]